MSKAPNEDDEWTRCMNRVLTPTFIDTPEGDPAARWRTTDRPAPASTPSPRSEGRKNPFLQAISALAPLSLEDLSITLEYQEPNARFVARLSGHAGLHAELSVSLYFLSLHVEALRVEAKEVVVDLRDLVFMNSSSIKAFLTWIDALAQVPEAERYRVTFLSDPRKHWQAKTLHAIKSFAADLISIAYPEPEPLRASLLGVTAWTDAERECAE